MSLNLVSRHAALSLAAILLGGCQSKPTGEPVGQQRAQPKDEYVMVQTTGSLLPRRVKISEGLKNENLKIEGADSPTLNQLEKTQMIQTDKFYRGSGSK